MLAAQAIAKRGISVEAVNLPWLNRIDEKWLASVASGRRAVFTLDNHYVAGGQGQMIAAAAAGIGLKIPVHCFGLTEIPVSGTNDEVLRHHALDADSFAPAYGKVARVPMMTTAGSAMARIIFVYEGRTFPIIVRPSRRLRATASSFAFSSMAPTMRSAAPNPMPSPNGSVRAPRFPNIRCRCGGICCAGR